ncbi:hypothetical protein ACIP02_24440 [Pseudomonas sp. NPDC089408]|uniref:hypothetical protein n=1 Tax=Pseudomonas sp. NPDC089408 TaxID=3364465 RepID=UPI003809B3B3
MNVENKTDNEIFQELQMFSKNVAPSPENRNLSSGNENKIIIFPAMKRTGHPVGFCYGGMTLRLSSLHLLPWSNGYVHA